MRRLVVTALLAATLGVPAEAGAPPAPPGAAPGAPAHVPGRVTLAEPPTARDWFHATYEAMAGDSKTAGETLRRAEAAGFEAHGEQEFAILLPLGADLDGDRVHDLLWYRTTFHFSSAAFDGETTVTLYSGRTGARRWHRRVRDLPIGLPYVGRTGGRGEAGLVLLGGEFTTSPSEVRMRAVGVSGRRGSLVYDKTITTADGRGSVRFGGTFDGIPGGGTDVLIGRVRQVGAAPLRAPSLFEVQPFVLDGSDGTIRSVRAPELVAATGVGYLATGDVDGDRRDDYVEIHAKLRGRGDVTLRGVAEEKTYWTTSDVPIGWAVDHGGTADITGNKSRDVVLTSWLTEGPLWTLLLLGTEVDQPPAPPKGIHGLLLDGATGQLRWDRLDGYLASYQPWRDLDRDGKVDVLVNAQVYGERAGFTALAVTGASKVLYRRPVTITPPRGPYGLFTLQTWAGDLDGDRVRDVGYVVIAVSELERREATGFFLVGPGRTVPARQRPFLGTLDGGTDERVTVTARKGVSTLTVSDGWRGPSYWTVRATGAEWWDLYALGGARGRCDGMLLVGVKGGALWIDALDGATGRTRWSRTVEGRRPRTTVTVSGRAPGCR